jgi:hypothetical protein
VDSIRFVSKGEYWFWMNSDYCRTLPVEEPLQNGDLVSLIWDGLGHYHSFVYINNQFVFSKTSPSAQYAYRVQSFEEMFSIDQRALAKGCWPLSAHRSGQSCSLGMVFHRCRALNNDFYQSHRDLSMIDLQLKNLEGMIFEWVAGKAEDKVKQYKKAVLDLYGLLSQLQLLEVKTRNKEKLFKLEALEYRVLGLILADVNGARSVSDVYPYLNYAFQVQQAKKKTVPLNYY